MATKLKIIDDVADIGPAPKVPEFDIAPTRKRHAGWNSARSQSGGAASTRMSGGSRSASRAYERPRARVAANFDNFRPARLERAHARPAAIAAFREPGATSH